MENKIVVAVKGVIIHQGKVLILKRAAEDEVGAGTWEMAGGKPEFGEKLELSLMREVEEETGLHIKVEKLLYATTFKTDPARQVVILTYLCKAEKEQVYLSEEHSDYTWAGKSELENLLPDPILRDFKINGVLKLSEIES